MRAILFQIHYLSNNIWLLANFYQQTADRNKLSLNLLIKHNFLVSSFQKIQKSPDYFFTSPGEKIYALYKLEEKNMANHFDITQIGFSVESEVIIKQNDEDNCIDIVQHFNAINIEFLTEPEVKKP